MIAMKREVAARQMNKLVQVFRGANVKLGNWRQVTVSRITSTKGRNNVPNHQREDVLKSKVDDTHGNVYSHRLSY